MQYTAGQRVNFTVRHYNEIDGELTDAGDYVTAPATITRVWNNGKYVSVRTDSGEGPYTREADSPSIAPLLEAEPAAGVTQDDLAALVDAINLLLDGPGDSPAKVGILRGALSILAAPGFGSGKDACIAALVIASQAREIARMDQSWDGRSFSVAEQSPQ